jgi:hypothetical protein
MGMPRAPRQDEENERDTVHPPAKHLPCGHPPSPSFRDDGGSSLASEWQNLSFSQLLLRRTYKLGFFFFSLLFFWFTTSTIVVWEEGGMSDLSAITVCFTGTHSKARCVNAATLARFAVPPTDVTRILLVQGLGCKGVVASPS